MTRKAVCGPETRTVHCLTITTSSIINEMIFIIVVTYTCKLLGNGVQMIYVPSSSMIVTFVVDVPPSNTPSIGEAFEISRLNISLFSLI